LGNGVNGGAELSDSAARELVN